MSEITVNVPLERFKELERAEESLTKILNDSSKYHFLDHWGARYHLRSSEEALVDLAKQIKEMSDLRDKVIKEVRDYENKTGKQVFKY